VLFTREPVQLSLNGLKPSEKLSDSMWVVAAVQDPSTCCLTSCLREPVSVKLTNQHHIFESAELQQWREEGLLPYSVHFQYGFWDGLVEWATEGKEVPPSLLFLQHAFPSHHKRVLEEVAPLTEEARACGLERDKAILKLKQEDKQAEAELKAAMQQLAFQWFPGITPAAPASYAEAVGKKGESKSGMTDPPVASASWQELDQRWNLSAQGFTRKHISKLRHELGAFEAVATVFTTKYNKFYLPNFSALYQRLSSGETSVQAFLAGNTHTYSTWDPRRFIEQRPHRKDVDKTVRAEVERMTDSIPDQQRLIKAAASLISQKICAAKQKELSASRSSRVDAEQDRTVLLKAQSVSKIKAIVGDLERELVDDTKYQITLQTCKREPPRNLPGKGSTKASLTRLALKWTVQDEHPGEPYHISHNVPIICCKDVGHCAFHL